jgi:hypothetical protein
LSGSRAKRKTSTRTFGWSIGQIEDNTTRYLTTDSNANVVLLQIGVNNMNTLGLKGKDYPPYQDGVQAQGAKKGKTLDELGAAGGENVWQRLSDRAGERTARQRY